MSNRTLTSKSTRDEIHTHQTYACIYLILCLQKNTLSLSETGITPLQMPCGYNDGGGGWIQLSAITGNYAGKDCVTILTENGWINEDFTEKTPMGTSYGANNKEYTHMMHSCGSNGSALVWYLKNPTEQETNDYKSLSQSCTGSTSSVMYGQYGMNTGVRIEW